MGIESKICAGKVSGSTEAVDRFIAAAAEAAKVPGGFLPANLTCAFLTHRDLRGTELVEATLLYLGQAQEAMGGAARADEPLPNLATVDERLEV